MEKPRELHTPHWARHMVKNYREELKLPDRVTDDMIYARMEDARGMSTDDEREYIRDLITETEETKG